MQASIDRPPSDLSSGHCISAKDLLLKAAGGLYALCFEVHCNLYIHYIEAFVSCTEDC